eukprot:jgi/Chlat1/7768/Chrsp66S00570
MARVEGSSALVWELVKGHNAFVVRQGGHSNAAVTFSREPLNLTNRHSFSASGLANTKAVGVDFAPDNAGAVVVRLKRAKATCPALQREGAVLKSSRGPRALARSVSKLTNAQHYRPDLESAALARLSRVLKAVRMAKAGKAKTSTKATKRGKSSK